MGKIVFILVFLLIIVVFPSSAHALVMLPPLLLIPIVKLVAIFMGGISIPAMGLGTLWSKLTGASKSKVYGVILCLLILMAIILIICLKLFNPYRPIY